MKKLFSKFVAWIKLIYKRVRDHFLSIKVDEFMHFNICMWLSFLVSKILQYCGISRVFAFLIGFGVAAVAGILKECYDKFIQNEVFDWYDLRSDFDGAFVGGVMAQM